MKFPAYFQGTLNLNEQEIDHTNSGNRVDDGGENTGRAINRL
jgi:hypothetical protein